MDELFREISGTFETREEKDLGDWRGFVGNAFGFETFADHHVRFWEWVWSLQRGTSSRPFVSCWPRGHAKSASAEAAVIALGAMGVVDYVVYVSETQDQADDHVSEIENKLGSPYLEDEFPRLTERSVNKYGQSKGWRRDRLATAHGLTVDALGLDVAARGVKFEGQRPGLVVFDDIDSEDDSLKITRKKKKRITNKILGAVGKDADVMFAQNIVVSTGIMARLVGHEDAPEADFLHRRLINGEDLPDVIPSVEGMETEQVYDEQAGRYVYEIVEGEATWSEQDLDQCETLINTLGISTFKSEHQQEVEAETGGLYDHVSFENIRIPPSECPEPSDALATIIAVDPAIEGEDEDDAGAFQIDRIHKSGRNFRLYSYEQKESPPRQTIRRAFIEGVKRDADYIVVETDQGGKTWKDTITVVWDELVEDEDVPHIDWRTTRPTFRARKAGATNKSKAGRQGEQVTLYDTDKMRHVRGTHDTLESALKRAYATEPFDLADASFWASKFARRIFKRWKRKSGGSNRPQSQVQQTASY